MKLDTPINNEEDIYIKQLMQKIAHKYGDCEVLRGQWIITFIYPKNGIQHKTKLKKPVLNEYRIKNKMPLTIKNLLK